MDVEYDIIGSSDDQLAPFELIDNSDEAAASTRDQQSRAITGMLVGFALAVPIWLIIIGCGFAVLRA